MSVQLEYDEIDAKKTTAKTHVALEAEDELPANTTAAAGAEFEVEFGDEDIMAKGDGFDKIAPPESDKKRVVRVGMLYDVLKPRKAWVHFVTNKGSFLCNSERDSKGIITKQALCCKRLGNDDKQKAQLNVLVLAFWYKNADPRTGKYLKKRAKDGSEYVDPIEYQIGFIKLSKSGYRRVSLMIPEDKQPQDLDLLISWKESGIGFEYSVISQTSRFRQNAELLEEVLEAAAPFKDGVALTKKLGKKITDLEWAAMLSGNAATSASDASIDDVSDL